MFDILQQQRPRPYPDHHAVTPHADSPTCKMLTHADSPVDVPDRDEDVGACRDVEAAQNVVLQSAPDQDRRLRVQPHRLIHLFHAPWIISNDNDR